MYFSERRTNTLRWSSRFSSRVHEHRCRSTVNAAQHRYTGQCMYTVRSSRISTDILWRVFHILTEPVPYMFVSVHRQNNEAMLARASLFRRLTRLQTYMEPVPLKYGKHPTKYPWIYGYFYSVRGTEHVTSITAVVHYEEFLVQYKRQSMSKSVSRKTKKMPYRT